MPKSKDQRRADRKSWKETAQNMQRANQKITALLFQAKEHMEQIDTIAHEIVDPMRLIITPGQQRVARGLDEVIKITALWKAVHLVVKGEDGKPLESQKEVEEDEGKDIQFPVGDSK